MKNIPRTYVALATIGVLALSACGSASAGDAGATAKAANASAVATDILKMPTIDDSNGLVLDGELVADKALLEAARADKVVWYTGSGAESAKLTAARFEAETGVKVDMTRMPSGKLNERVLSEAGAGRLSAGVVTITDPTMADGMTDGKVFTTYTEMPFQKQLEGMKNVVWRDGAYYTSYYSAYAFAYNSKAVKPEDAPKRWADLVDQKWKNKLGIVNAGAGGTVQGLAAFQEDHLGKDYWAKLAALKPRIFDTTSVQLEAMARGEILAGTAGFNSTYGAEKSGAPVKLVVPEDGISGTFNMQGLTTTGSKSAAAKLFMNWTWSKAGQNFAAAQGFVAARTDIDQVPTGEYQLPKASDPSFIVYTPDEARTRGADIVSRWNKTFNFSG
jgi:iron(III) transport system substrate-binding protein